jgi:hypothetical protein
MSRKKDEKFIKDEDKDEEDVVKCPPQYVPWSNPNENSTRHKPAETIRREKDENEEDVKCPPQHVPWSNPNEVRASQNDEKTVRIEGQQPRERNQELAAKVAIFADENEERRQDLREQNTREESSFPPSVIAIPENVDNEEAYGDELDSFSRSIPFVLASLVQENQRMSGKALEEHFQEVMEMLVDLQKHQYEALSKQHTFQSSLDVEELSMKKENTSRASIDPPASHVDDGLLEEQKPPYSPSLEERKPPFRPDPPAMHVLIGDMVKKLDPNGEIQSNDLSDWVLERLNPATRPSPNDPIVSSSELDSKLPSSLTMPLPGQQTTPNPSKQDELDQNFEELPNLWNKDELIQNFEEKWENAAHLVQSVVGAPPSQRPPDNPVNQVASTLNTRKEPGAIRVTALQHHRARAPTAPGIAEEMVEQKPVSTLSDPVMAHVVDEDEDLQLRKMNEAIASLQQQQLEMMEARVGQQSEMMEAKVVRAEPVIEEDNDDSESFFETHGYTMLMICLAVGVGFLLGLKKR